MNDHLMNALAHTHLDDIRREMATAHLRALSAKKPAQDAVRTLVHTYASLTHNASKTHNRHDHS